MLQKRLACMMMFLFAGLALQAQTFVNFTGYPIPGNAQTLVIPIPVNSLPAVINGGFGINRIILSITHPSVQELEVRLKAPDNTEALLFTAVGGLNGANFQGTQLRNDGQYAIEQGTPPFSSQYFPMDDLNKLNNGQNPNATWFLIVTDTYPMANTGTVDSVSIRFGSNPPTHPPTVFVCPTCNCPPGITDCDLLPDMTSSEYVILNDMIESPGSILIGNGTPNIGIGPLEVRPVDSCFCGITQVPCTQTSCPGGGNVQQRLHQRIYHKHAGNDTLSWYEIPAGNMSYHPNHSHVHVDGWADFTLREKNNDPDPRNWPVVGTSVKQSYCLINLADCDGMSGACKDNLGTVLDQQNQFINYGLGYLSGCGKFQGIWPGKLDIYSSGLNAPIDLQSICNGDYYIVSITDPDSVFHDADYSNNVVAVPVSLTQQIPASTANFSTTQTGAQVVVNASGLIAGANYIWDFGDNSPLQTQNPATHTYTANGDYEIMLWVSTPCGDRTQLDTVKITGVLPSGVSTITNSDFFSIAPNPSNGSAELTLWLADYDNVTLTLGDLTGRQTVIPLATLKGNGLQKIPLQLKSYGLAPGLYTAVLQTASGKRMQKILLTE